MRKNQLELLVEKAKNGDRHSLNEVLMEIKDLVYNLSLKMLLFPEDAQDASQEILVKITTHLATFKGESQFKTWVYRVATNYLLTAKAKRSKNFAMSFDEYSTFIDTGHSDPSYVSNTGELRLLEEEVKIGCTQGLLMCLNSEARVAFILGEILEMTSEEAAEILEISQVNYRKKLSRARQKIRNFLEAKCGLVNSQNPCRCKKKINFVMDQGLMDPQHLVFAPYANQSLELIDKISNLQKTAMIYQTNPDLPAPIEMVSKIRASVKLI